MPEVPSPASPPSGKSESNGSPTLSGFVAAKTPSGIVMGNLILSPSVFFLSGLSHGRVC